MADRFAFSKSWGGELLDAGGARFRLWAPSQQRLAVRLQGQESDIPMHRAGDGWFEAEAPAASAGDAYWFVLGDGMAVSDPAARAQTGDVHSASLLVDPRAYAWKTESWAGRPWEETVFYELHTGTFSEDGTFDGVRRSLDHLAETGITALELLPVAQFAGTRGWGYDGVLLYAPHQAYGGPVGLKRLVDAAHERGLMVFLDVVYNHFGPDGNYLSLYAEDFFHPERHTPWGAAIAYEKKPVRDFFIDNALYWLEEFRMDGLRLDAVDQIAEHTEEPFLEELARAVRSRIRDRHVHLTTEDDRNITSLHERGPGGEIELFSGEWNDDVHHAAHTIATREGGGYYVDYKDDPVGQLARALATGFIYQGEASEFRDGAARGVPSAHLPPTAFVNFLQNHDQVGNRAFSERLAALADPEMVELLTAILLLSPQIPLLFMGEEWGETRPFGFFTDFHGELGDLVREGRRKEFGKWPEFALQANREKIADPNAEPTFAGSRLDWSKSRQAGHSARLEFVRTLLHLRQREIVPLLASMGPNAGRAESLGDWAFRVSWQAGDRSLQLLANLSLESRQAAPRGAQDHLIYTTRAGSEEAIGGGTIPARTVACLTGVDA